MENNANISCLRQLLDEDSSRMISGEAKLKSSLPDWMIKTNAPRLKNILHRYIDLVEEHLHSLTHFFEDEQLRSMSSSNSVIEAMIADINEKLRDCTCPQISDAALLAGVQTINHYKISIYGTAAAFADAIGLDSAAEVFHRAQSNEKDIDEQLSHLAGHEINVKALAPLVLKS